jgi:hypothetical protein
MTVPQAPFSPSPIPGQVQGVDRRRTLFLEDPHDRRMAAGMLADGAVLGHGFGNIYAITSRPDATTVRAVNLLKGRPADQVGSITTTPTRLPDAFDWSQLPAGLSRSHALDAVDALLALGPCGFRGPAAAGLPSHLTQRDANVLTTQVISPGYACPSNAVFALALGLTGGDYLYVTSANRSRHTTGAVEEPAHHTAAGLRQDFEAIADLVLLLHRDEDATRSRLSSFALSSTSILALHRLAATPSGMPALVVERHGSLSVEAIREVLHALSLDVVLGPRAQARLPQRHHGLTSRV